jgi:hypothetical protein
MSKAANTLSILDVVAPNRSRFTVISNPSPTPAKSATMRAIEREVAKLPQMWTDIPKEDPLPGVTDYGRVFDQPAYTAAVLARLVARRNGGAL